MTFTIGHLIRRPALATRSLTPGVGEWRPIEWAHVCELAEPWLWIGNGALVMTTGLAVPSDPARQCAYIEGMHDAGIAAVTIGDRMSAPPLSARMLERAAELEFPVLATAHAMPFITLAMAVAEENSREHQQRIRVTERLYEALRRHAADATLDELLNALSALLGAEVSILAGGDGHPRHGHIARLGDGRFSTPLLAPGDPILQFVFPRDATPDFSLLQHAGAIVSSLLAVRAASLRRESLHGSLLLGDLLDASISAESATRLLEPHAITPPYVLACWQAVDATAAIERTHRMLGVGGEHALLTTKDGMIVALAEATSPTLEDTLAAVTTARTTIALSRPFRTVADLPEAFRQAHLVLTRRGPREGLIAFDETEPESLFLLANPDQLRDAATRALGALMAYDQARGTDLLTTLRVFLEENRSWVRTSQRLFIHRQTLVSRIARIEELSGRQLDTTDGAAELWYALRAAVESGLLPPSV